MAPVQIVMPVAKCKSCSVRKYFGIFSATNKIDKTMTAQRRRIHFRGDSALVHPCSSVVPPVSCAPQRLTKFMTLSGTKLETSMDFLSLMIT